MVAVVAAKEKEWVVYHPTVELRPVQHTRETLEKWTQWLTDPDVHLWMTGDVPKTQDQINQWLYNATHDTLRHYFSIFADGQLIGMVNLRQDHAPFDTAEVGIVIGEPDMRSRGIGKETLKNILTLAKNDLKLKRVRAHILPENEKSLRLFTNAGFVHTANVTIHGKGMLRFEKML